MSEANPRVIASRRRHPEAGFTILELLAVMAIVGVLSGMALGRVWTAVDQARVARAIGDIKAIQTDLQAIEAGGQPLPGSLAGINRAGMLDPWGRPYVYDKFPTSGPSGAARKDQFGVEVNTTFDLYSLGKDGATSPPLNSGPSLDDIVRANDGGFIGLGRKY